MCEKISTKLENTAASHLIIYWGDQPKLGGTEEHFAPTGKKRNTYRVWDGKPEKMRAPRRPRLTWGGGSY